MPTTAIIRTTLFKVQKNEDFQHLVKLYTKLRLEAKKNDRPYILSCTAGPTIDDSRSQGYNFMAHTVFADKQDMDYYDQECAAHKELKEGVKGKITPPVMVAYYQDALPSSSSFLRLQ